MYARSYDYTDVTLYSHRFWLLGLQAVRCTTLASSALGGAISMPTISVGGFCFSRFSRFSRFVNFVYKMRRRGSVTISEIQQEGEESQERLAFTYLEKTKSEENKN